jgi:hypothetical protein
MIFFFLYLFPTFFKIQTNPQKFKIWPPSKKEKKGSFEEEGFKKGEKA